MAVNRRLVADLMRQKCIPGAIPSVDAESCYDRITHAAGSLCAQTWDIDPIMLSLPTPAHTANEVLLMHSFWHFRIIFQQP
jgi:hypothetical protein